MDDEIFRDEREQDEQEGYDTALSPNGEAPESEAVTVDPEPDRQADESLQDENLDISLTPAEPQESEADSDPSGDEKSVSSDLIRGHINTIILRSLYDGDKYGYAILAEIERKSHKQYQLKQPSLYSALKRLEKDGYITSYWGGSVGGGRRKYFSLTDAGKAIAERNQMEWEYSRTVIDSLISDRDFDFDQPAPTAVDMRVLKQSTSRVPSGERDEDFFDDSFDEEPLSAEEANGQSRAESEAIVEARAAFEAERNKIEEELRAREEALRAEEEARALREEEQARLIEELRVREENLRALELRLQSEQAQGAVPAQPAQAAEATPEQITETTNAQAAKTTPEQVTETTPVQATEITPEQVTETTPAQAAEITPEQVTETTPAQAAETTPEQITETTPVQAAETTPEQTTETTPAQAAETTPEQTTETTPAQTNQESEHRYWNEWRAMESARLEEEAYMRIRAEAAAKARYEEELRRRQEEYLLAEQKRLEELEQRKAEEIAREANRIATEEAQRAEAERLAKEQVLREQEARIRAEETRLQEERARVLSLNAEKEQQNARIMEMQSFIKEREQYERTMQEREQALKERHQIELAEQEKRIRRESEEQYRQREQELLHKNYLDLVQNPQTETEKPDYSYFSAGNPVLPVQPKPDIYAAKPEEEREYRSIIQKLYSNAVKDEPVPPVAPPVPPKAEVQTAPVTPPSPPRETVETPPKPVPARSEELRSLDGIDFYDLETRASQDGIRITTSGTRTKTASHDLSDNLVHKGKALFFSALIVFLICLAEGSLALGFLRTLSLPRLYPFLIWGVGLAVLLVCGLAYVNHYGERALRQTGNLLVNSIVAYALCIVLVLIIALASKIEFSDLGQLMTYVIIPIVFLLNIVVFSVSYHLQIKPKKD